MPRSVCRALTVLGLLCLAACSFSMPRVHKIVVQQGNVITQEMIDRLKPGMTRRQVSFVMGDPVLRNGFTPDRWDYVYMIQLPNQPVETRHLSLFFKDEVLAYFTGDFVPSAAQPAATDTASVGAGGEESASSVSPPSP